MPEFSKNTDHPVLTAKVVNSWNGLKKPFLAQVGYHPPDFRGVCGWAKQNWAEQPLTNRVPLLVGCLDTAVASLCHPPLDRLAFHRGFRLHLRQIPKLHGPPASVGRVTVVVSYFLLHSCAGASRIALGQSWGAHPASPVPAEGAVVLGSASAPQPLLLHRQRGDTSSNSC